MPPPAVIHCTDLNDLYYYVQVVDHGGFAPAGRALGMPKSKLSRRIALLEERLGTRLIQRSTRRFAVTETGQTYYGIAAWCSCPP
jgi:DNA-binding transcriptional LysR family regulator